MRILWFAILVPVLAASQSSDPPALRITGVVRDSETKLPIAEANVSLIVPGRAILERSKTDALGAFQFQPSQPGYYEVQPSKPGYFGSNATDTHGPVNLSKENPHRELELWLVAANGEISGQVVDEETGRPIARVPMEVVRVSYSEGKRQPALGIGGMVTDDEGRFAAKTLRSGEYLLRIVPRNSSAKLAPGLSDEELQTVDEGYREIYWPGYSSFESAIPLRVSGGTRLGAGLIKLSKTPHHRVRISTPGVACSEGDRVEIKRLASASTPRAEEVLGFVPCGQNALLRFVAPGEYRLALSLPERGTRPALSSYADFVVLNKDLDVSVSLQPAARITGRLEIAEGSIRPASRNVVLTLRALDQGTRIPISVLLPGTFTIAIPTGRYQLTVPGLPGSHYVKEMRYQGQTIAGGTLNAVGGGSFEIVIGDRAASLSGSVRHGEKSAVSGLVILAKWPPHPENVFLSVNRVVSEDDGGFRIAGLAPGEYRVIAVSRSNAEEIERPGVLERLLRSAQKVDLDPGALRTVTLPLTDPQQ